MPDMSTDDGGAVGDGGALGDECSLVLSDCMTGLSCCSICTAETCGIPECIETCTGDACVDGCPAPRM
ncbi:MAG: hypothetical protein IPK60_11475 [Sandaracinaceae bacterium]|nr:hypothetical protein [Sandaracinaceae bacterium]